MSKKVAYILAAITAIVITALTFTPKSTPWLVYQIGGVVTIVCTFIAIFILNGDD